MLDGELVVTDSRGHVSSEMLHRRASMKLPTTLVTAVHRVPATLCVFDVMFAGGQDVRRLPLAKRRGMLRAMVVAQPGLQVVSSIEEHGESIFAKSCEFTDGSRWRPTSRSAFVIST